MPRYGLQHSWRPSIDVFREPDGLAVVAEPPGVEQADVQVSIEDNRLRIAGIRRPPVLEGADPLRLEIDYGPFERCVSLPADSDGESITAQLHHGLRTVHVPRRAPAAPGRRARAPTGIPRMSEQEEQQVSPKDRVFGFEEDLSSISVPEILPVLPLRGVVVFPSAIVPLLISRGSSLKVVEQALAGDRMLALVTQKRPEDEEPTPQDLFVRGAAGRILKMLKYPDQSVRILVQGLRRIDLQQIIQTEPFYTARVRELSDIRDGSPELEAMQAHMVNLFAKFVSMIPYLPDELQVVATNIKDAGKVADLIAANLNVSLDEKQELLTQLDVRKRLERLTSILNREIELLELGQKIQTQVQDELTKNQKDFYLRQQMRAIQKELGEGDPRL